MRCINIWISLGDGKWCWKSLMQRQETMKQWISLDWRSINRQRMDHSLREPTGHSSLCVEKKLFSIKLVIVAHFFSYYRVVVLMFLFIELNNITRWDNLKIKLIDFTSRFQIRFCIFCYSQYKIRKSWDWSLLLIIIFR